MRYHRIEVENFLLFRGAQVLDLPDGPGVTIVYGRNGKGKTSLLTAFRWAFTGEARRRGNRRIAPEKLINREVLREQQGEPASCKVRVLFEADGQEYDLTRKLSKTETTASVVSELLLVKDGVPLPRQEGEKVLAEIMPAQVEQFFHFDGELLDQYEQLVDDDSAAGMHLRTSIEQILGVPVLEHAARDLQAIADEAGRELAKAARQDTTTRELGSSLEQAQSKLKGHQENLTNEEDRIRALEQEQRGVEQQAAEQQNQLVKLALLDSRRETLKLLKADREAASNEFIAALPNAWKAILAGPLNVQVKELEEDLERLQEKLLRASGAHFLLTALDSSGNSQCPACHSPLSLEEAAEIRHQLGEDDRDGMEELKEAEQDCRHRLKTLRAVVNEQTQFDLQAKEDAFRKAEVAVEDAQAEIRELEQELAEAPTEDLRELTRRRDSIVVQLDRARSTWQQEKQNAEDMRSLAKSLTAKIDKVRGKTVDHRVRRTSELASSLAELFTESIARYRDTLKEHVAEASTELFRNMRTETDFQKLSINDQFGLRILDSTGSVVEGRSAGYEHLVALSLIGALQRCSPISGPIVMDTPFGRLDPEHVLGVLGNLDKLTDQVILLAHEGEISPREARQHLLGRLLAEYDLVRVSSTHTQIRERRTT